MVRNIQLIFSIILVCSTCVFSQIGKKDSDGIFKQIPAEQRTKLVDRLNLFIKLEKEGKWNESFGMISGTFKQNIQGGYSLDDYKKDKNTKIDKFVPESLTPIDKQTVYTAKSGETVEGQFFINGCGRSKAGTGNLATVIEAYWEKGDWYFSFMEVLGIDSIIKCTPNKKKQ